MKGIFGLEIRKKKIRFDETKPVKLKEGKKLKEKDIESPERLKRLEKWLNTECGNKCGVCESCIEELKRIAK
jgi:hypothetical protein